MKLKLQLDNNCEEKACRSMPCFSGNLSNLSLLILTFQPAGDRGPFGMSIIIIIHVR